MTEDIDNIKKELRRECKRVLLEKTTTDMRLYGEAMANTLFQTEMWQSASTVFCFVSMKSEPNTEFVLNEALHEGKTLAVPLIVGDGIMKAVVINSLSDLESGTMGISEPKNGLNAIDFKDIDLAVLPCMCASIDGYRLGRGGGYYDRFMEQFSGTSAIFCLDDLVFDTIPVSTHDAKTDCIITPKRLMSL